MTSIPSRYEGIVIPPNDPFQNDKLGYKQYAPVLTGMVDMFKDTGCVLAVNGKWGTGKTTFMQMWRTSLPKDKYSSVYFNAWETDYFADPLLAILGELREISQDDASFRSFCASIGKVAAAVGGAALKGVLKKATGIDADVIDGSVDAIKSSIQNSLDEYEEQKQSLVEFKTKLSEYVASQDGKPVVFIIDELDRCNPHYAVRVLEIVKHLFDVPNICFVLAIDKSQLECSIKGFYGSSEIDADNYLRRFIDIEFKMPSPDIKGFTELLFNHYSFGEFFGSLKGSSVGKGDYFKEYVAAVCKQYQIDLRTQDKILSHTRLALIQLGNDPILIDVVFLLCFLRVTNPRLFDDISTHRFTVQDLLSELERLFPRTLLVKEGTTEERRNVHTNIYTIAPLLLLYNCINGEEIERCFDGISEKRELPLRCLLIDSATLLEALQWFKRQANPCYGLNNVLSIVNLLRQFN